MNKHCVCYQPAAAVSKYFLAYITANKIVMTLWHSKGYADETANHKNLVQSVHPSYLLCVRALSVNATNSVSIKFTFHRATKSSNLPKTQLVLNIEQLRHSISQQASDQALIPRKSVLPSWLRHSGTRLGGRSAQVGRAVTSRQSTLSRSGGWTYCAHLCVFSFPRFPTPFRYLQGLAKVCVLWISWFFVVRNIQVISYFYIHFFHFFLMLSMLQLIISHAHIYAYRYIFTQHIYVYL